MKKIVLTKEEYKLINPIGEDLKLPKADNGVEIKNNSTLSDAEFIKKVAQIYNGAQEFALKKDPNRFGPFGLYPHQRQAILAIAYSLVNGHFGGTAVECAFTFSRRGGKTEGELLIIDFLLVFGPAIFEQPLFEISMTVNKQDQATFYGQLFEMVNKTADLNLYAHNRFGNRIGVKVQGNSKKKEIAMNTGGILRVLSLKGKNHTGFNSDWLIIAEAQDVEKSIGEQLERQLKPTLGITNGLMSYSGVANDHETYFKEKLDKKDVYVLKRDTTQIIEILKLYMKKCDYRFYRNNYVFIVRLFEKYKNGTLSYKEKRVFETEFLLKWLQEGLDSFVSMSLIEELKQEYERVDIEDLEGTLKVGIDYAKENDRTVVTIVEQFEDGGKRVVDWLTFESKGMEYTDQVKQILYFLVPYLKTGLVDQILNDNTGVGSAVVDFLKGEYKKLVNQGIVKPICITRITFNAKTKDEIGNMMLLTLLARNIIFPQYHKNFEDFYKQMETLQKTTRNGRLTYKHRNQDDRDDFPDSLGLALLGFTPEYNKGWYGSGGHGYG